MNYSRMCRDSSPFESSSVQEVVADEDLPPWPSSGSAAPPEENFITVKSKMSLNDILRGVKVREDTLQCVVARLGGGTQGLQVLMELINSWALGSQGDEDAMVAISRGIDDLGMPPALQRHSNSEICITSGDGACESVSQGTAYTRTLRKSHMMRQRGQTRAQQRHHPTMSKRETQSRQCRISTSHDHRNQLDMESEFSNGNVEGYKFLFQKLLRASDVSSLGRIVLPKKEAEKHLPFLDVREGIMLPLQDYHCGKSWIVRYRFWPNNKSRMYLLENMGDFVNFHHLQEGDLLLCYRNYQGCYVLRGEKVLPNVTTSAAIGLSSEGAQASPAADMKIITTIMPSTHLLLKEEIPSGTHNTNLANSSSNSLNCTLGEMDDAKFYQDRDSGHQGCVPQQSGNSQSDHVCTDSPALFKPPVLDEDLPSAVAMIYVSNLMQRYLDENQFL